MLKVIFGENASLADYVARIESARVYDVARVLDETLNLRMRTAEERRRFMD